MSIPPKDLPRDRDDLSRAAQAMVNSFDENTIISVPMHRHLLVFRDR